MSNGFFDGILHSYVGNEVDYFCAWTNSYMHNPYSSPQSAHLTTPPAPAPRPISAWLLLVVMSVFTLVAVIGTAGIVSIVLRQFDQSSNYWGALLAVSWRVALFGVLVGAMLGIFKRKQWGRWLGVLVLAGFGVAFILLPDTTSYANAAERFGGQIGRLVLAPLLLGWWAYAFAFSAKAKRYYSAPADVG